VITLPGLIDSHVHFRTPGQAHKEDFETGSRAAIAGGFTAVIDMPNNAVPITTAKLLREKKKIAKKQIICDAGFYFGSLGDNLNEFEKVKKDVFGIKLFLNITTGHFIIDEGKLVKIYKAWPRSLPVLVHAEDDVIDLVIKACSLTKKKTHVCHVASADSLKKIISAKKKGLPITCGITPHHLFLGPRDTKKLGAFGLFKPPIIKDYRDYFWRNLNMFDCIESDHAPHTIVEKKSKIPPFGLPNLETTLGLLLTAESEGLLTIKDIKRLCHSGPAKIFGIKQVAQIEVDENEEWVVEGKKLFTKCKWSPFEGKKLKGKVKKVFIRNKLVFDCGIFLVKPGFGRII
jgi:dihydroorotase (multifunctional complex type)